MDVGRDPGDQRLREIQISAIRLGCNPLYILADKGLDNLVRVQMQQESPAYIPGERYEHPLFAALANGHKGAAAALLGLSSTSCVDIMQGLKHRKDLTNYKGRTPLTWVAEEGRLSIVKALIEGGANTRVSDRKGCSPLKQASK